MTTKKKIAKKKVAKKKTTKKTTKAKPLTLTQKVTQLEDSLFAIIVNHANVRTECRAVSLDLANLEKAFEDNEVGHLQEQLDKLKKKLQIVSISLLVLIVPIFTILYKVL